MFPRLRLLTLWSSGMWGRAVYLFVTNVSDEFTPSCSEQKWDEWQCMYVCNKSIGGLGPGVTACKLTSFHLLTPWCRVLLEKLTGLQLVKKFPAFHGTRRFITALTSVRHLSLSWASPIQSIYPHPTSWRSILILSAHLHLGLPSTTITIKARNP